jgi:hypothetical protein
MLLNNSRIKLLSNDYLRLLLVVAVVLFFNGPNLKQLFIWDTWQVQFDKSENVFLNIDSDNPSSHNSKLNTRILVPLLIRYFNLSMIGLYLLQVIAVYFFYLALFRLLEKEFNMKKSNVNLFILAIGFSYLGSMGFTESRAIFDIFSITLVFWAYIFRRLILLSIILMFLAFLNDERSILTISGFYIFELLLYKSSSWKQYFTRFFLSSFLSLLTYILYRIFMQQKGVITHMGGVHIKMLLYHLNAMPFVYFNFLEGLSLMLVFKMMSYNGDLKKLSNYIFNYPNIFLLLAYLVSSLSVFLVYDLGRSMNYYLPLVLIILFFINKYQLFQKKDFQILLFFNLIIPTYNMEGPYQIFKSFPIIFQFIKSYI